MQKCWRGVLARRRVQERSRKRRCFRFLPKGALVGKFQIICKYIYIYVYKYIEMPGTLNNNTLLAVSIGWFQIFTWKMVVSPNIHFKLVVWGSRHIYLYKCTIICNLFMKDGWMIFDSFQQVQLHNFSSHFLFYCFDFGFG